MAERIIGYNLDMQTKRRSKRINVTHLNSEFENLQRKIGATTYATPREVPKRLGIDVAETFSAPFPYEVLLMPLSIPRCILVSDESDDSIPKAGRSSALLLGIKVCIDILAVPVFLFLPDSPFIYGDRFF